MQLPDRLKAAIAAQAATVDSRSLAQAAAQISERYRRGEFSTPVMRNQADHVAYAITRMPATYAACRHVFEEVRRVVGELSIDSLLDLGAGLGSASWAALEAFPSIQRMTLLERDRALIDIGKALAREEPAALRDGSWVAEDIRNASLPEADLLVMSYALGEMSEREAAQIVSRAQSAARKLLVVIEPGTVRGFGYIHRAREQLIQSGSQLVAPCPHHETCPMAAAGDWCHFAERVERTAEHRRLKGADLGYEDEKFSCVASTTTEVLRPRARIVRHPLVRPGHIQLTLCTAEGLQRETVGKSSKEKFRAARSAYWGAPWE